MYKKSTPKNERITVLADKGYQGMDKHYPGADLIIPEKKPKGGNLTDRQKKRNKKISSKRIIVEHPIGRIKQWGIMSGPYDETIEDFHREIIVTTGLANLRMLWNTRKKKPRLDY